MKRESASLIAVLLLLFACSSPVAVKSSGKNPITALSVTSVQEVYTAGDTISLAVNLEGTGKPVFYWKEGDRSSPDGWIEGGDFFKAVKNEPGDYTFCVKAVSGKSTKTADVTVRVEKIVRQVSLLVSKKSFVKNETIRLSASANFEPAEFYWKEGGDPNDLETGWVKGSSVMEFSRAEVGSYAFHVKAGGMVSSAVVEVKAEPDPLTAVLKVSESRVEVGKTVVFTADARGPGELEYYWKEGGDPSDLESGWEKGGGAREVFRSQAGVLSVYLMVKSQGGTASASAVVEFVPAGQEFNVQLGADRESALSSEMVAFTAQASGENLEYFWKVGGDVSDLESGWEKGAVSKLCSGNSAGFLTVHVMVKSGDLRKTASKTVEIKAPQEFTAVLVSEKSSAAPGELISMTAEAAGAGSFEYFWKVGGDAADLESGWEKGEKIGSFSKNEAGVLVVHVMVKSGDVRKTASASVEIKERGVLPSVTLTSDKSTAVLGETIILTAKAEASGVVEYFWKEGGDPADTENGWKSGGSLFSLTKSAAGGCTIHVMAKNNVGISVKSITVTFKAAEPEYPIHNGITASLFWVGEPAGDENGNIQNVESAWRGDWMSQFGLEDSPKIPRNSDGIPTSSSYKKIENPYYFALPYNDIGALVSDGDGSEEVDLSLTHNGLDWGYKKNRKSAVYWANEFTSNSAEISYVKNRWIKITANGKSCYAQWEDAGPFYYNDISYVFGTSEPANKNRLGAGIDLSPAVMKYLFGDASKGEASVSWQFVSPSSVPDGSWKQYVTVSQPGGWQ